MDDYRIEGFERPSDWTETDEKAQQALIKMALRKREEQRERELKELKKIMNMNDGALI